VFQGLARVLVSGLVIPTSVLLAYPMGVRGGIMQLSGSLVVFVMGSVVVAC
jgi:hypothetical protein